MKLVTRVFVFSDAGPGWILAAERAANAVNVKPKRRKSSIEIDADAEFAGAALQVLAAANIRPITRTEYVYDEADFASAELAAILLPNPEKYSGGVTRWEGTDDSSACRACGSGTRQRGSIQLPVINRKGEAFATLDGEVIISDSVASKLRAVSVDLDLRPVRSQSGTQPWWQLLPTFDLPPLSGASVGLTRSTAEKLRCEACRRDGHGFQSTFRLTYDRRDLPSGIRNKVGGTWELMGTSKLLVRVAHPIVLVGSEILGQLQSATGGKFIYPVGIAE